MSSKTYSLDFDEHHINSTDLPDWSGIYCIYAFEHNDPKTSYHARGLLYIGESENIRERVSNHEHREDWENELDKKNEVLLFRAAPISPKEDRERAEAAMIYHHKPPCNTQYVHSFPFDKTTIEISGKTDHLTTNFTVGG